MKSRLPPQARLTKKQQRIAMECAERHLETQTEGIARRYCKLLALALREPLSPRGHGMGATQILKVLGRVDDMAREYARNPDFWEEADHLLIERMGLPFEREAK